MKIQLVNGPLDGEVFDFDGCQCCDNKEPPESIGVEIKTDVRVSNYIYELALWREADGTKSYRYRWVQ